MNIPQNHQAVMPYLMLHGAPKFIDFTIAVFGADAGTKQFRDDGVTLIHAEIHIAGSTIMIAEATEQWQPQTANLFVYVANADDTFAKAIDNDATVVMELSDQSYGRTCGVSDPFGNVWWITSVIDK